MKLGDLVRVTNNWLELHSHIGKIGILVEYIPPMFWDPCPKWKVLIKNELYSYWENSLQLVNSAEFTKILDAN
jgi:hypothetical protein